MKKGPRKKPRPEPEADENPDQNPDPDDLFSWGAGQQGRALRDEGMALAQANENGQWHADYFAILTTQPGALPVPFKGEDYRAYVAPLIGEPHDPHVWSANWGSALKMGLIVKLAVPSVNCTVNPRNHACRRDLYRWPGVEVDFV